MKNSEGIMLLGGLGVAAYFLLKNRKEDKPTVLTMPPSSVLSGELSGRIQNQQQVQTKLLEEFESKLSSIKDDLTKKAKVDLTKQYQDIIKGRSTPRQGVDFINTLAKQGVSIPRTITRELRNVSLFVDGKQRVGDVISAPTGERLFVSVD